MKTLQVELRMKMIKEDVRIIHKTNWIKVIVFFILVGSFIYAIYYNDKEQGDYIKSFKGENYRIANSGKRS